MTIEEWREEEGEQERVEEESWRDSLTVMAGSTFSAAFS